MKIHWGCAFAVEITFFCPDPMAARTSREVERAVFVGHKTFWHDSRRLPSSVGTPARSLALLCNFTLSDLVSSVPYGTVTDVSSISLSLSDGPKSSYYFSMQH